VFQIGQCRFRLHVARPMDRWLHVSHAHKNNHWLPSPSWKLPWSTLQDVRVSRSLIHSDTESTGHHLLRMAAGTEPHSVLSRSKKAPRARIFPAGAVSAEDFPEDDFCLNDFPLRELANDLSWARLLLAPRTGLLEDQLFEMQKPKDRRLSPPRRAQG